MFNETNAIKTENLHIKLLEELIVLNPSRATVSDFYYEGRDVISGPLSLLVP